MIEQTEIFIHGPHEQPDGWGYRIEARAFSPIQAGQAIIDMWKHIATITRERPVFIRVPPTFERYSDFDTKQVWWNGFTRFTVLKEQEPVGFGELQAKG